MSNTVTSASSVPGAADTGAAGLAAAMRDEDTIPTMTSAAAPVPPALAAIADEVFFAITSTRRFSTDDLRALFERHAVMPAATMELWEPWLLGLCAAIAPIAPPHWMPMARAIDAGLSLEGGARGLRSLFTSEPSEHDILRVRALGPLAVRILAAVFMADGRVEAEDELHRRALIASMGLPRQDQAQLLAEPLLPADAVALPDGVEPKIAAAIIRGAYYAAMSNGLDPREEQAIRLFAIKLDLTESEMASLRAEARDAVESSRPFGEACMDVVRYMLDGEPQTQNLLGAAALSLTLPPVHRLDGAKSLAVGHPVVLGKKHNLDYESRQAVLALGWVAALRVNPTYTRRLELTVRHARFAEDLGDDTDGRDARHAVQDHLDSVLYPQFSAVLM
jgi:hypothetical protein